jgi:hypothetical protein
MTRETSGLLLGYFPLWGASLDSDSVGLMGGTVAAYVPSADEWRQVTKFDVWMERFRNTPLLPDGPEPPVCLVVVETPGDKEDLGHALGRLGNTMIANADEAVLALRLLKAGWFLDPGLSERIFSFGLLNQRLVGPYRQAFINGVPENAPPGYRLSIGELARSQDQAAPTKNVWRLIQQYRKVKPHASADIAIENFHRSYGYQLPGTQRAVFLFMALDAMLGGMSVPRFRGVEITCPFRARITAALQTLPHAEAGFDSNEEASWLDSRGREIRNAVAHGNLTTIAEKAEKNYNRIQSIVRLILRQYLEFSVKWATQSTQISSQLAIPDQSAPAAVYNKLLEAQSYGNIDASDLLRPEISAF